jgi:hypothetical protein
MAEQVQTECPRLEGLAFFFCPLNHCPLSFISWARGKGYASSKYGASESSFKKSMFYCVIAAKACPERGRGTANKLCPFSWCDPMGC